MNDGLVTLISEDNAAAIKLRSLSALEPISCELVHESKRKIWKAGEGIPAIVLAVAYDAAQCFEHFLHAGHVGTVIQGRSFLAMAIESRAFNVATFLLRNGGYDALTDNEQEMPCLHLAVKVGDVSIVKLLLSCDRVDVNKRDVHGMTPLLYTVESTVPVLRALMERSMVDVHCRNDKMENIVNLAAVRNRSDIIKFLLAHDKGIDFNNKDIDGNTPLFIACRQKFIDIVTILVSSGRVNVNERCNGGRSALTIAAGMTDTALLKVLLPVPDLDVNTHDDEGVCALHVAVCCDRKEAVMLLLNHPNIQPNLVDVYGRSSLKFAFMLRNVNMITMLLSDPFVLCDVSSIDVPKFLSLFPGGWDCDVVSGLLSRGVCAEDTDDSGVSFFLIGHFLPWLLLMEVLISFALSCQQGELMLTKNTRWTTRSFKSHVCTHNQPHV